MDFLKKHPYVFTGSLGSIAAISGFMLTFNEPAKALMYLGMIIVVGAGCTFLGDKSTD